MIWLILLAGAVAARVIIATLRHGSQTSISRTLLYDFSMRRTPPDQPVSQRDRLWTGATRFTIGIACLGAGAGLMTWGSKLPNLSTANNALEVVGIVLAVIAVVFILSGAVELLRAPFARRQGHRSDAE